MAEQKCPHCGSTHFHKAGFLASGKQRYLCNDCKKGFSSFLNKNEILDCIYCKSKNVIRHGIIAGQQEYLCKDCNKRYTENTIIKEQVKDPCPYCGGKLTVKGWSNNHTVRRYVCKSCGKSLSGDISKYNKMEKLKPCPYCNSTNVKKSGKLASGSQRYYCNDCNKQYSENTVIKEAAYRPDKCPKCGESQIRLCGKSREGKQRYLCVSCNYKFVENPQIKEAQTYTKTCPKCQNTQVVKNGKTHGKQYWKCTKCGHKFLEQQKYRHKTEDQKESFVALYQAGVTQKQIAEQLNTSVKTVYRILKENQALKTETKTPQGKTRQLIVEAILKGANMQHISKVTNFDTKILRDIMRYEYAKEKLTEQQKDLIIKFGVNCAVPVDYLAPYIPCSQRMCKQILRGYEIKEKKLEPLTEQQKAFDRLELDKFIRK